MPPVRTIEFKVTHAGLVPGSPQFAGVQGEHNATRVSFLLDTVLQTGYVYRIEYVDGRGNWDTTDLLTISDGAIAYDLPSAWTRNGGEAEIHLVASALDSEGKETQTYFSLAGKLYYEDKSADETGETKAGLTELIQDTHEAIDEANQATDNANEAADAANEAAGSVNEALSNTAEAIDGANAARDAANLAAREAKEAAATAEEEAEAAHQITLTAQAAAGKADIAATAAQNAASAAQSAASAANTAAGTANTAAGTANTAASAANAAAEAANEAADAANEAAESIADKVDKNDALTVIPTVTLLLDFAGDLSYDLRRDGTGFWLNGAAGEAVRVVSDTAWQASGEAPKYGINTRGGTKPIKPAGTYPAGAYILMYDGEAFQVQADMAYTDERAEQAADKAAEAHAAQVRRTYQPAWKRTAGGCPVSVADAAEGADLSGLVLKGRTVVSGTPSPDAPVTITGVKPQTVAVTQKNLLAPQGVAQQVSSHGITMTNNGDGTYTFNGTADGSGSPWFSYPHIINYPSGWYTLNPQGMKDDNGCMTTIYDAPTYYTARGNQPLTFYLDESKGPFGLGFQFAEDAVLENVTVKPMLTYGQESREFEPYHGETITSDEVELYGEAKTVGKNLIPTFRGTASVNGVTVKLNMDGSITLNGTATANTYINFPHVMIKAGTYTLSSGNAIPTGIGLSLREANNQSTNLLRVSNGQSAATGTITYNGDAYVYISINSGTTVSNLTIYPQLEAGSEATAYEPYQGMTTALEDGDSLDLATGELTRRWQRLELDGTEAWTASGVNEHGINNFRLWMNAGKASWPVMVYCTHYVEKAVEAENAQEAGVYLPSGSDTLFIRDTYTTVEDFKAYLAAQKAAGTPVTVLYKIAKSSIQPEVLSSGAQFFAQPEGEMVISALGTRGETAEAVDTEALYTYRPDWDDVLNRLAESEVQQAEMQTVLEQIQAKLAELTATE